MESVSSIGVFYDFIEDPERASEAVRRTPPIGLGLLAYAFAAFSAFLAEAITGRLGIFSASLVSLTVLLVWHLGVGIMQTALVHLVAEVSGGEGRAAGLFVLLGLSELAWALVLPGVLVVQAFFPDANWGISAVFLAVGILCLWLKLRSIQLNYRIGGVHALFALLFPYLAVAASLFFIFFAAIAGFIESMARIVA